MHLVNIGQQSAPGGGQASAAGMALEQLGAQMLLESGDAPADG